MASESSVTEPKTAPIENQTSVEATIKGSTTTSSQGGAADSTCNDDNNGETSDPHKSLDFAVELSEKGTNALKENDFSEAVECFSRALEIRVLHHGELALECVNAYYLYGRALLYKAQEEADPLAMVPKKDSESKQDDNKDGACRNFVNGEFSSASVSINVEEGGGSNHPEGAAGGASSGKEKEEEEDDEGSDDEDLAEADEEESDLDLAWKMLDVARAIAEKHLDDTMDKVDILSALAEVALEREDIETSLSDYQKALSILERLVEPDSRHLAELNFRICLCLEIGSKPQEAIPYCQEAISVCKARLQRLIKEVKSSTESATSSAVSELDEGVQQSSNVQADKSVTDKEAEIETLSGLSAELEKKLEDLQQLVLNPKSILAEILGMVSDKAKCGEKSASPNLMSSSQLDVANSGGSFDSPTISSAHTNGVLGVTDLGVAGRGVKRVLTSTGSVGSSSTVKKPTPDPLSDKGDGKTC
ncbi:PREDICTED: protein HGV2-like [Populus euphratica]|uniref:Protein HGV2-like n=1 Tax=Populus euphratica TaxID=75702 RepID=A0AAJ6T5G8_POPEU|nr:PREDICTED: protein HGV2-like [Populus euphratica]XP_011004598.1 PREDICTED: protein HGV2-like [Populus euphratica]XP_011004599.1 PREDICTED: protein HGV2-like [Populus euphratica]